MRPHVRLLLRLLAVGIAGALGGVIWLKAFDSGQGGQPARAAVLPAAAVGGPLVPTADTVDPPAASSASLRARITIPVLGEQKVRFLLGPYGSSATATDAAVAEQTHVPFVSTNGAAQAIYSQRYPYVFGVLSPASKYLQGVLDMAASMAPKPTTMAILSADDSSSVEVAKSVLDYAPRVGMQVVDNKRYPNGSTNLYAQLAEAKQKKPDIVLNSGHLVEAIANQQGRQRPAPGLQDLRLLGGPGDTRLHPGARQRRQPGLFGLTVERPGQVQAGHAHLGARLRAGVPAKVRHLGRAGLPGRRRDAGAWRWKRWIETASSLDPDKLRDALVRLDIITFYGRIKFDQPRLNTFKPMVVQQIQNGLLTTVWPLKLATAKPVYPTPTWLARAGPMADAPTNSAKPAPKVQATGIPPT